MKIQAGVAVCPKCREKVINIRYCGFFKAAWSFIGVDSRGIERRGSGEVGGDNYTAFVDGENEEWGELRIEVEPLEDL